MSFKQFMSGAWSFIKFHKGEICAGGAILTGLGAVGCAIYETPKAQRRITKNTEDLRALKVRKEEDPNYSATEYKKDLARQTAKTVGNAAYDYKGTILCEAASIIFTIVGVRGMRKVITATSGALATTTGILAMTEEAIKQEYGEEGLLRIKELRANPIRKVHKEVDPETGDIQEREYIETPPDMEWLDENARDFLMQQSPEIRARFDPTCTVLLDEGSHLFKTSHGDLDILSANIKNALQNSNITMWDRGRIYFRSMIDDLEFNDISGPRWNQDILDMAGTVDMPEAYDMVQKKFVKIKGFDDDGIVEDRKVYGEFTHKYLSYGEDQDKFFFARPESTDHPYFIIDGRILLELSYDGNISNYAIGRVTKDRKRSAWTENPEIEK